MWRRKSSRDRLWPVTGSAAGNVNARRWGGRKRRLGRGFLALGRRLVAALATSAVVSLPSFAQGTMTYSPLTGIAVGPSGPASAKIKAEPYCCPSTALVVKANQPVSGSDDQWVNLGLSVPGSRAGERITGVEVCYEIHAVNPDTTYIWQTRLTAMTTPNAANVILDDPIKRKGPGPTCYGIKTTLNARGTVTLALKVVFANTQDEIRIGMVRLSF